jgi:predicted MFS family arabinose efflux permease
MGSYLLALASLMAATGRLADLYGRRRLFIIGACLFGAGSLACAVAPSQQWLIATRALEGVGGALVIPLGMANATADLPEERRGWVIGIVSTGATVLLALGPLIGGSLVELVGWRWAGLGGGRPADDRRARRRGWAAGRLRDCGASLGNRRRLCARARPATKRGPCGEGRSITDHMCRFYAEPRRCGTTERSHLFIHRPPGRDSALADYQLRTVRWRCATLTAGSMLVAAAALVWIALFAADRQVGLLLPAFLAFGFARPVATVAPTLAAIPRSARGLSTSLVTQSRQLGAVMGVAAVKNAAASAFVSGFRAAMLVAALLAVIASVIAWRLLRPSPQSVEEPIGAAVATQ